MNIVLCGMPGSGKTTVGRLLAERLHTDLVDTDAVIVERYGEINRIFAGHGEEYFRDIETRVIKEVAGKFSDAVISVGGGAVLRGENVQHLKETGRIIYLCADSQTLVKRLEGDKSRPLLKGDTAERIGALMSARAGIYRACADFIIETDGLSPEKIVETVMELSK